MSETDALTNLANRRKFDLAYESEWERALRLQQPMAVVILVRPYGLFGRV